MRQRLVQLALLALCLTGCAGRAIDTLQTLPLPEKNALPHSGQALQRLIIDYQQHRITLSAALAQHNDTISVVLLDALGKRLLSITKRGDNISQYRDPALPDILPAHFLLAATVFAWSAPGQWQDLEGSPWSLTLTCHQRLLSYRNKAILSATFVSPSPSREVCSDSIDFTEIGTKVTLTHHRQPLTISITTEQWQPL